MDERGPSLVGFLQNLSEGLVQLQTASSQLNFVMARAPYHRQTHVSHPDGY